MTKFFSHLLKPHFSSLLNTALPTHLDPSLLHSDWLPRSPLTFLSSRLEEHVVGERKPISGCQFQARKNPNLRPTLAQPWKKKKSCSSSMSSADRRCCFSGIQSGASDGGGESPAVVKSFCKGPLKSLFICQPHAFRCRLNSKNNPLNSHKHTYIFSLSAFTTKSLEKTSE